MRTIPFGPPDSQQGRLHCQLRLNSPNEPIQGYGEPQELAALFSKLVSAKKVPAAKFMDEAIKCDLSQNLFEGLRHRYLKWQICRDL